jgi:hypothetical protein
MSHPVPGQPSPAGAARADVPSTPPSGRPLPEFPLLGPSPYSPIDREIERSQRASAALAATRALARASFTDSQLAADDAASRADDDGEADAPPWVRTEYAALDHAVRPSADDDASRHLLGGSFDPGIASQHGRAFPTASITHGPIRTRTGAQARFLQESRQTPRPERPATPLPPAHAAGARDGRSVASKPPRTHGAGEPMKFLLAVGLGSMLALIGGGVAWKVGVLSRNAPVDASVARVPAAAQPPIEIAPAAGVAPTRSSAELDAALAAAARAAAVPAASVRAAGPAPGIRSIPAAATQAPQRAATPVKDGVAAAIANAQSRSDKFLSSQDSAAPPPPPPPAVENDE